MNTNANLVTNKDLREELIGKVEVYQQLQISYKKL